MLALKKYRAAPPLYSVPMLKRGTRFLYFVIKRMRPKRRFKNPAASEWMAEGWEFFSKQRNGTWFPKQLFLQA